MARARRVDAAAALLALPLMRELAPEQLQRIARGTQVLRVPRNAVIFDKGDTPTAIYLVLVGQVKLTLSARTGEQKVLQVFGPGQSFGEAVLFLQRPYPAHARTLGDATLLRVSREALMDAIDHDPAFARRMLGGLSARLHELVHDVEALSMRSAAQRLVGYLLNLSGAGSGGVRIALPTSKHLVASRLNLTAETLSRVLNMLSQDRLIEVDGRSVTIHDIERLKAYA